MKNIKIVVVEFDTLPESDMYSMERGWGNGYIGVPKEHECFGLSYNDDTFNEFCSLHSIHAHGGFTYSEPWNPEIRKEDNEYWWFGFDTAHGGDTPEEWTEEKVNKHTSKLAFKFITIEHKLNMLDV